jgi:HAD superfamily hydrolase (TIGR01509 family)
VLRGHPKGRKHRRKHRKHRRKHRKHRRKHRRRIHNLGVVFDLDGTLVETETIWRDVRRDFVLAHGGRWHEGAQATMIGMRTNEWARYMHEDLGVALKETAIADSVVAGVIERLREVPILPGASEALERLGRDFQLGLATSAALPVANAILQRTGWRERFAVVVSADEVGRGKPAPDVYLRALELLDIGADRAVAVEDSSNGIRAASNAQLRVIAVPNREFPPDPQALSLASRTLARLDALDAPLVRSVLAR